MIKIKLTTNSMSWPLFRQTPNSKGIWDDCQFIMDEYIDDCDYWVVVDNLPKRETVRCLKENTILITGEPPTVKKYSHKFIKQFGTVVTCYSDLKHPNVINSQQALPWHVGRRQQNHKNISFSKDYDELKSIKTFHKDKLISVISSDKTYTKGHKKRLVFVKKIAEYFGGKVDVFGRGIREIEDKWDAIANYKYHIALENSCFPDYWTEKLSDVFLAGAYPIYYGCPNLSDYFPNNSFDKIDIDNFEKSICVIENCLRTNKYDSSINKIMEARNYVLDKYNLFPVVVNLIKSSNIKSAKPCRGGKDEIVTLVPEQQSTFAILKSLCRKL